jgi:peptidoglycan/xylan/chitin deacetylase (PgdA/CDA1 family)
MNLTKKNIYTKAGIITLLFLIAGCSGNKDGETSTRTTIETEKSPVETASPAPAPVKLTVEELKKFKPNELGWVMVLEYHRFGKKEERWTRTPENFRKDLERLYKEGYYLTPLRDFVNNKVAAPAGKTPVVLTFDDGTEGQFRYLKKGSETKIDPESAVGVLEDFCKKHPDFGKAATFYVLPRLAFGQTPDDARKKLKFLADNGYEIGNHTIDHTGLNTINDQKVKEKLGEYISTLNKFLPDYPVNTLAYPYGGVPKNLKIVENGDFKGTKYHNIAALLVGAEPTVSVNSKKFKPFLIPRIQAIQTELDRYFALFKKYPELRYISDGNPETVTIPENLPEGLKGTLKDDLKNDPRLVKY